MPRLPWFLLAGLLALPAAPARAADRFELQPGDRVVFLGSTFIEREQLTGYWETALTSAFPDRDVTFRNLGWSGDTVWGEARASFDTAREGYQRLLERTRACKPTVIFLGYGTNESFAGAAGLPAFRAQLNKLLDDLAATKARFVLLAPPMFEASRWRAGNLEQRRDDLQLYTDAIREVAGKRGARFVEEFCQRSHSAEPLTDDGMHLTPYGYWRTARGLLAALRVPARPFKEVVLAGLDPCKIRQDVLPNPPPPPHGKTEGMEADCFLVVAGLNPGKYALQVDGRPVQVADAEAWMHPVSGRTDGQWVLVRKGPSLDQAEKLRRTIVEKNRLYFERWRPENETYLFGFRKHEQGQNAKEIPQFDEFVARKEAEIARLRKPVPHTYQLVPAGEEKK
jgi:lysophospholipase L1-like esterase